MKKDRLTPERIRRFTLPADKNQAFLWDAQVPHLAVRATKTAKAFVFESKLDGRTMRMTIGSTADWSIDDARVKARHLQTLVDQGVDPREEKTKETARREAARRAEAPALDAWDRYLSERADKWRPRTLKDHERHSAEGGKPKMRGRKSTEGSTTQPGILRPLLERPLSTIDADAVTEWLTTEVKKRPTQARISFGYLRTFVNWCAEQPDYKSHACTDAFVAKRTRDVLPETAVKADCLQREMLGLWFERVIALANPVHSAYLQVLLLTGARREELTGLQWCDVDFRWQSMTIGDKVDVERTIPLTPYVAFLLSNLPRRNEWVFSSPAAASGRLQEPRAAHNKALTAAGLPPLSLHGLRRSFGTLAEWVECPVGISAQIMGHKPSATAEKHYRVRPLDLLRKWHTTIEAWILEQAGIEPPKAGERVLRAV